VVLSTKTDLPIFDLCRDGDCVRCFNALTDRVGAATYHLVNHKRACHEWLARQRIPVPAQTAFDDAHHALALDFLRDHAPIVVKPCMQWGGRGVSMGVRTPADLHAAVRFARHFEPDVCLKNVPAKIARDPRRRGFGDPIRRAPPPSPAKASSTCASSFCAATLPAAAKDPSN
jgi:hypothetical protein